MKFCERLGQNAQLGVLLIVCLISRLPQLLGNSYVLDGDEAVVGLMAKHIAIGKDFPLYFYGQTYGFSFIEAAAIVPFYLLFGPSALVVKLVMLALWSFGIVFLFLAMRQIAPARICLPFGLALLMVANPAWAIWSMKARGGYLTAFLLWSVVLYLLFHPRWVSGWKVHVAIGVLCVVIAEAQPLWIAPLLPFFLYRWGCVGKRKLMLLSISIALAGKFTLLLTRSRAGNPFWPTHEFGFDTDILQALRFMPIRVFEHFTGAHSYEAIEHIPTNIRVFAILATLSAFWAQIAFMLGGDNARAERVTLSASVFAALVCGALGATHAPRYLLPLSGALMFGACLVLSRSSAANRWVGSLLLIMTGLGFVCAYQFRFVLVDRGTMAGLSELTAYLSTRNIHGVFSHDRLLPWQLMFLSDEKIAGRFIYRTDRYPEYVSRANAVLASNPELTAEVGYRGDVDFGGQTVLTINDYIVVTPTNRPRLEQLGFQF